MWFRSLFTGAPQWMLLLFVLLFGASSAAAEGERQAEVTLSNRTGATLLFEFVPRSNIDAAVEITIPPHSTRAVMVPSGYLNLTVSAPRSLGREIYTAGSALSTGGSYQIAISPSDFGVREMYDDDPEAMVVTTPELTARDLYDACTGSGGALWVLRNPAGMSILAEYYQRGGFLCGERGVRIHQIGPVYRGYHCMPSFRECIRDESWDGRLGEPIRTGEGSWSGVKYQTTTYAFDWLAPDIVDWELTAYR